MARAPGPGAPLAEWLRWQEALHPQTIVLGLERVRAVGARLGLPAPIPAITVAGTNGKGSSTVLLSEIYGATGLRVGTYTSPHLHAYNERVVIDRQAAGDGALCEAFAAVERARGATVLTYFEYGTLAALWLFREARAQLQVLEVGLGGRLDAVNLVDGEAALVTSVGLDHQEYLGADREAIGREKAGIFRAGRPAVCADPAPPASIGRAAEETGAELWQLGRDFRYQAAAESWHWEGGAADYRELPPPALAGEAQLRNAAGAIAVVTRLQPQLPVPETAIRAGLARLHLPGRFERRGRWIFDVAHNVEAAQVLADNLRAARVGRIHVVLGMLADKPVEEFSAALAPHAAAFHAAGLPGPRGLPAARLAERLGAAGPRVSEHTDVAGALRAAEAAAPPGATILVCGSFLTVAAAREQTGG